MPLLLAPHLIQPRNAANNLISEIIGGLGLATGLVYSMDAGDIDSFDTGDTIWTDQAGNLDFFLGTDATGSNDPTFNGTPGSQDNANFFNNWSSGAALFRGSIANPPAVNNWHKDNAALTFMAIYQHRNVGGNNVALLGTDGGSTSNIGIRWWFGGSNAPSITVSNGGTVLNITAGTALNDGQVYILFASYDESAGAGFQSANKTSIHTISGSTYSTPSALAATYALELMRPGNNGLNAWSDNANLFASAAWSTALSKANCDAIHDAINAKRGYV